MTNAELLDRAATLAQEGRTVGIVAASPREREVLRKGINRRLAGQDAWLVTLSINARDLVGADVVLSTVTVIAEPRPELAEA